MHVLTSYWLKQTFIRLMCFSQRENDSRPNVILKYGENGLNPEGVVLEILKNYKN